MSQHSATASSFTATCPGCGQKLRFALSADMPARLRIQCSLCKMVFAVRRPGPGGGWGEPALDERGDASDAHGHAGAAGRCLNAPTSPASQAASAFPPRRDSTVFAAGTVIAGRYRVVAVHRPRRHGRGLRGGGPRAARARRPEDRAPRGGRRHAGRRALRSARSSSPARSRTRTSAASSTSPHHRPEEGGAGVDLPDHGAARRRDAGRAARARRSAAARRGAAHRPPDRRRAARRAPGRASCTATSSRATSCWCAGAADSGTGRPARRGHRLRPRPPRERERGQQGLALDRAPESSARPPTWPPSRSRARSHAGGRHLRLRHRPLRDAHRHGPVPRRQRPVDRRQAAPAGALLAAGPCPGPRSALGDGDPALPGPRAGGALCHRSGCGRSLFPDLRPGSSSGIAAIRRLSQSAPSQPRPPLRKRRGAQAALLAALALASLAVGWLRYSQWRERKMAPEQRLALLTDDHAPPAVAVLGFKNLSGAPGTEWLSGGLAEMLSTELGAGGKLRLIAGENVARTKLELGLADTDSSGAGHPGPAARAARHRCRGARLLHDHRRPGGTPDPPRRPPAGRGAGRDHRHRRRDGHRGAALRPRGPRRESCAVSWKCGEAGEPGEVRAALPASPAAARLYSEGLNKLRLFDPDRRPRPPRPGRGDRSQQRSRPTPASPPPGRPWATTARRAQRRRRRTTSRPTSRRKIGW